MEDPQAGVTPEPNQDPVTSPTEGAGSEDVEALKKQLTETQEELAKLSKKDHDFGLLEKKVKEQSAALEEKNKELGDAKASVMEEKVSGYFEDSASVLIGGDDEAREKLKYIYENDLSSVEAKTKEEVQEKVRKAYGILASSQMGATPNPINQAMGISGSPVDTKESGEKLNKDQLELAKKLGIEDEVLKNKGLI